MKLLTFSKGEGTRLGTLVDSRVVDLSASYAKFPSKSQPDASLPSDMRSFLEAGDTAMAEARRVEEWVQSSGEAVSYRLEEVRIRAPILNPRRVISICQTKQPYYPSRPRHRSELCDLTNFTGFTRFPDCLIATGDSIPRPRDWAIEAEGELALIIGRQGKHIAQEMAFDYVAGYAPIVDVSTMGHEGHPFLHKCLDASAPMGPYMVTPDEVGNPPTLNVTMDLNGSVCQRTNTGDLDFEIPHIVSTLSHFMTLLPGDIIACSMLASERSNSSVRTELHPGDRVTLEIEGLGKLSNPVVADCQTGRVTPPSGS